MNQIEKKKELEKIINLLTAKKYEEVISKVKPLVKKFPNDYIFYNALGMALMNLGQFEASLKTLDKAIKLLDKENQNDFNDFVNTKISFNPHNMFICKSKKILNDYYATVFPWLKRCEKEFGFKKLDKWSEIRIYAFLAERFMSYWFQKNSRYKTMPIVFYDIKKDFI